MPDVGLGVRSAGPRDSRQALRARSARISGWIGRPIASRSSAMMPSPGCRAATSMRPAHTRSSSLHLGVRQAIFDARAGRASRRWPAGPRPRIVPWSGPGVGRLDEVLEADVRRLLARDRGEKGLPVLGQALDRVLLTGDLLFHQDGLVRRIVVQLCGQLGAVVHGADALARVPRGRFHHRGEADGPVVDGPARPGWDQYGCGLRSGGTNAGGTCSGGRATPASPGTEERSRRRPGRSAGATSPPLRRCRPRRMLPPASGMLDDSWKEGALARDRPVYEGDLVDSGSGVSGIGTCVSA